MRTDSLPVATPDLVANAASERGMRWLLLSVIALFVVQDIFDVSLSLGPGLSAKNALLYAVAVALAFKLIVQQSFVVELRSLHVCFVILIAYSLLSLLAADLIVQYPRYSLIGSTIALKSRLVDHAILLFVFFYGLRESRNAHTVLRALLLAVVIGNTIAVLNAWGVVQIGDAEARDDGRLQGLMGEPNQDAAFGALFLPGLVAALIMSRGVRRAPWLAGLLVSFGAIVMTASRGGFVAIIVSTICGAVIFRRYISLRRIAAIAGAAAAVIVPVLIVMIAQYGDLLYERVVADSISSDMVGASSGRLEVWANAITMMTETPLTLLTGFGWNVYWSLPTRLSPHNYYLSLWFNVGVVGLVCGTMLLVLAIRQAVTAVRFARPQYKADLAAFAIGALAISIATFFVDLYAPWLWFWTYAGLAMRIAVNSRPRASKQTVAATQTPDSLSRKDPFGWPGTARQ